MKLNNLSIEERAKKNKEWMKKHPIITGFIILIIIGFVIDIFTWSYDSQSNTTPQTQEQTSQESRKIMSIAFAKSIIEDTLKSPSTAKYSSVEAYELSNEKDVWAVNGYVDSQNGFGAMLRSQWEIQLDYRDGKGGAVKSFIFDGKKIQ